MMKTTPTSVAQSASPYDVLSSDAILFVDSSDGPVTIRLQSAAARENTALVVKDIAGEAPRNAIKIVHDEVDTGGIDGWPELSITGAYGCFQLFPGSLRYAVIAS